MGRLVKAEFDLYFQVQRPRLGDVQIDQTPQRETDKAMERCRSFPTLQKQQRLILIHYYKYKYCNTNIL